MADNMNIKHPEDGPLWQGYIQDYIDGARTKSTVTVMEWVSSIEYPTCSSVTPLHWGGKDLVVITTGDNKQVGFQLAEDWSIII